MSLWGRLGRIPPPNNLVGLGRNVGRVKNRGEDIGQDRQGEIRVNGTEVGSKVGGLLHACEHGWLHMLQEGFQLIGGLSKPVLVRVDEETTNGRRHVFLLVV
jgi:hypothetical protein